MLKKAIIASAVLAASAGLAFANGGTYVPAPSCTHSVYVGVAVSRDFFHLSTSNRDRRANLRNFGYNIDTGNDGWDGNLNLGIGWVLQDHYYLGAEIFGGVSSAKIEENVSAFGFGFNHSVRYKYNYGIAFIPGVKISDSTMLYGRVGYIRGSFRYSNSFAQNRFGRTFRQTSNRSGLQLGLGLETMVTNNVSAKLEYDYNRFSNVRNDNFVGSVRPVVDTVMLGVAYHFMSA